MCAWRRRHVTVCMPHENDRNVPLGNDVFAFISKPRHSALSKFTSGLICVVGVAFKASRSTLCRMDHVCD